MFEEPDFGKKAPCLRFQKCKITLRTSKGKRCRKIFNSDEKEILKLSNFSANFKMASDNHPLGQISTVAISCEGHGRILSRYRRTEETSLVSWLQQLDNCKKIKEQVASKRKRKKNQMFSFSLRHATNKKLSSQKPAEKVKQKLLLDLREPVCRSPTEWPTLHCIQIEEKFFSPYNHEGEENGVALASYWLQPIPADAAPLPSFSMIYLANNCRRKSKRLSAVLRRLKRIFNNTNSLKPRRKDGAKSFLDRRIPRKYQKQKEFIASKKKRRVVIRMFCGARKNLSASCLLTSSSQKKSIKMAASKMFVRDNSRRSIQGLLLLLLCFLEIRKEESLTWVLLKKPKNSKNPSTLRIDNFPFSTSSCRPHTDKKNKYIAALAENSETKIYANIPIRTRFIIAISKKKLAKLTKLTVALLFLFCKWSSINLPVAQPSAVAVQIEKGQFDALISPSVPVTMEQRFMLTGRISEAAANAAIKELLPVKTDVPGDEITDPHAADLLKRGDRGVFGATDFHFGTQGSCRNCFVCVIADCFALPCSNATASLQLGLRNGDKFLPQTLMNSWRIKNNYSDPFPGKDADEVPETWPAVDLPTQNNKGCLEKSGTSSYIGLQTHTANDQLTSSNDILRRYETTFQTSQINKGRDESTGNSFNLLSKETNLALNDVWPDERESLECTSLWIAASKVSLSWATLLALYFSCYLCHFLLHFIGKSLKRNWEENFPHYETVGHLLLTISCNEKNSSLGSGLLALSLDERRISFDKCLFPIEIKTKFMHYILFLYFFFHCSTHLIYILVLLLFGPILTLLWKLSSHILPLTQSKHFSESSFKSKHPDETFPPNPPSHIVSKNPNYDSYVPLTVPSFKYDSCTSFSNSTSKDDSKYASLLESSNNSSFERQQPNSELEDIYKERRSSLEDCSEMKGGRRMSFWSSFPNLMRQHPSSSVSFKRRFWNLFLAFTILVSVAVPSSACHASCVCKWKGGKMTVECVNKGLANLPAGLDAATQVLDFNGNSLTNISREKFKELGITNLQRIYVSRCKLVRLDDFAFKGLSNLVELDLSHNELNMVPVASFEHTRALMRLLLSHNPIRRIRDRSFYNLQSLTVLEMTGCNLEVLEPAAFEGLDKLEWLKLNDNKLTTIPNNMALPRKLHGVDLHNNPWHCDCKLKHLMSWLVNYKIPASIEAKCKSPYRLQNTIIKDVEMHDFACAPEIRPTSLFRDVLEGRNVSFECHVIADPMADIDWRFNGYSLQNSSLAYDDSASFHIYEENGVSHLRIEMVTEAQDGVFQCAAENTAGKMISNFTLRVSIPATEPVPNDFIEDNFEYIGIAAAGSGVAVFLLLSLIVCKCCCRRKSRKRKKKKKEKTPAVDDSEKEKERNVVAINSVPKYIQMGSPSPKTNGISNVAQPISVIEASPYRSNPAGTAHPNPDLISDSSVEERTKPKKKVSILGVEEVDSNGIVTTRKLDDIAEEYEENYVPTFDQPIPEVSDYESQDSMNPYSNISTCRIIANANPYPLIDIPSDEFSRQSIPINGHPCEVVSYSSDRIPKDDSWISGNGNRNDFNDHKMEQAPSYATLRRSKMNEGPNSHLLHSKKFPEEYQLQSTNPVYQRTDGRFTPQNYGIVVEKYHSDGTTPTTASTSLTGCDCCPDQKTCGIVDSNGRMSGDGCSFDNLLSSCGGGTGPRHCCYAESSEPRIFDNSLPENYTSLGPSTIPDPCLFEAGPLPPEGWRDSDCMADTKDNNITPWDSMPLSPGTRILYSPEETVSVHTHENDNERSISDQSKLIQSIKIVPPATQV